MTGSILQLVATGIEDIFLTNDPQITYFKVVYKRHTNFARQEIRQNFIQTPDFETQVSSNIGKHGDLMEKTTLIINLPDIPAFDDPNVKVAWVRYIGYSIINTIDIEINGRQICKHFGEWMMLWNQMFNKKANEPAYKRMIGDVPELTNFSNSKSAFTLYIPLQFWFCRSSSNALPLISLLYSDVKINLSLRPWSECIITTPTHSLYCNDDLAAFYPYEYIQQEINGLISAGIFAGYDSIKKRLLYSLITTSNFKPIPSPNVTNQSIYRIIGQTSGAYVTPAIQSQSSIINPATYKYNKLSSLVLGDTYLLINYIFVDEDERLKFSQSKHDYIIEQVYYNETQNITAPSDSVRLNIDNPCKYIIWILQQEYLYNNNDYYNYTETYRHKIPQDINNYNIKVGDPLYGFDQSLITYDTILFNSQERLSLRDSKYFRLNQVYEKCINPPPAGTNAYFFTLDPVTTQQCGSSNMSKIEKIEIKMNNINKILSGKNVGIFRSYAETYNILRISNGLGAIMFDR
jgi:hypothetical protein